METIHIRPARYSDMDRVIPLLMEAMGDIAFRLTGTENIDENDRILKQYYLGSNSRISCRNCFVIETTDGVCAAMACYGGDEAPGYDEWMKEQIYKHFKIIQTIDPECYPDEFYIDSLAVKQEYRGHRFSSLLIEKAREEGIRKGFGKLSLIADGDNPVLKAYYTSLGFEEDELMIVNGHPYRHMIKRI